MVAVSLVSFQANQNIITVCQINFWQNSSYDRTLWKDFLNFFTLSQNSGMSHEQRNIPFKSNNSKFEEEKPPKNMLFVSIEPSFLRMKSVQKSKFWNLSRSSNRRGNNSFPQIKTHCSVMKCHCFHVSRWHLLKVAHPINHCQKEIFGMFKKKEHCSFYGSTNFIWSDNYVIEKEAILVIYIGYISQRDSLRFG